MNKPTLFLRFVLVGSSIMLFFHSLVYGVDRSIPFSVESNKYVLGYVQMVTYLTMSLGIILWRSKAVWAFGMLLIAIFGRLYLEYEVSILGGLYNIWPSATHSEIVWVAVFYAFSFVLPACVLIDLSKAVFRGSHLAE